MALPKTCSAIEVFRKHSGTLMDAIPAADRLPLAWKLYQGGIITRRTLEKVEGQPEYERISTILGEVRKAVNTKQELLLKFVTILEQTDSLAAGVAAEMRKDMNHESPLESYCKTCDQLVCQRCTIHLHQDHDHAPVTDELFTEQKQQIEDWLLPIKQQLSDVTVALQALETRAGQISDQGEEVKAQIDTTVQQAWERLQESKKQLKEKVDTLVQQKLQFLSQQREEGKHRETQLKSCLEDVKERMKVGSQQHVLVEKHQMLECITDISSQVKTDELQPVEEANITFDTNEKLLSQCSNLGEINFTFNSSFTASQVVVKGKGKEVAVARERTSFELNTSSQATLSVPLPLNLLSCQLTAPNSSQPVEYTITPTQPGNCIVQYTPTARGPHQLRVTVGGCDIPGTPFTVCVLPTFEMRGRPLNTITELDKPCAVAVKESGEVVVSEWGNNCIGVLSREGKKIRSFGSEGSSKGQFLERTSVALTSDNHILVADENHRIQVFTLEGEFLTSVGEKGNGQLQFDTPSGIAVHPSGKVFVAESGNHRIQVLHPDMSYSHMLGSKGSGQGQFIAPQHVAFDSSGVVYVTDYHNNRVQKFSVDGEFISSFGSEGYEEGQLSHPRGICIDSTDTVYISEWSNHRVSVFNSGGQFLKCFSSHGSGEGEFKHPDGLAVDNTTGNLFVCDCLNNRVVIY